MWHMACVRAQVAAPCLAYRSLQNRARAPWCSCLCTAPYHMSVTHLQQAREGLADVVQREGRGGSFPDHPPLLVAAAAKGHWADARGALRWQVCGCTGTQAEWAGRHASCHHYSLVRIKHRSLPDGAEQLQWWEKCKWRKVKSGHGELDGARPKMHDCLLPIKVALQAPPPRARLLHHTLLALLTSSTES